MGNIGRPYSVVEALFSHSVDIDCGKPWTINGYAKVWDWSRGKVRRFLNSLRTHSGHIADRKGTQSGHPVHLIDGSLWGEADKKRTHSGHIADSKRDTTSNPNPKPNPKTKKKTCDYSPDFESFWQEYPKKIGKGAAYKSWKKVDISNGMVKKILSAVSLQKKTEDWVKDNGRFIPHPSTWLNQARWDDEVESMQSSSVGRDACESLF